MVQRQKPKFIFIGLIFLLQLTLSGQEKFTQEIRFINHMLNRQNLNEALFLLQNIHPATSDQRDTVNYLLGWTLYGQKELKTSAHYLSLVSEQSPFLEKSRFFAAYNNAYLRNTTDAAAFLNMFDASWSDEVLYMKNFQLSGISLLDRRMSDFDALANSFSGTSNITATEEQNFRDYRQRIAERPERSAFLAGLMSAAVPGLGKIYAGKTAEGVSGLLYVGAMMAVSFDFYNRFGSKSPLFWISSGISGIFYIGNIWGSATAVKRVQNEFNYEIDQRILLDMHIPLRKLFP
ncbi:MAG: hypothetical protein ABR597_04530 [Bacteroidales bacterium]